MSRERLQSVAILLGCLQWVLLTSTLGALVIHTDRSLEGMIEYHIDSGYMLGGALVVGFLMGATYERSKVLIPGVILSCFVAATMYAAVLFLPVWTGTITGSTGLQNFATTRVLLYFSLTIVPAAMGALAGRLIGPSIPGRNLLDGPAGSSDDGWWATRTQHEESPWRAPE